MTGDESGENTYIIDSESAAEMGRLIDQDYSMNEAMGSLFPEDVDLAEVHHVLDVACGPGGWAQEVARSYSTIQVVGIDISQTMIAYAMQRAQVLRLLNASFLVMDARAPLAFPDGAFDLVNARFMSAFLPRAEWPGVTKEFARLTRRDGIIVLTEVDIFSPDNTNSPALEEWNALCREAAYRAGLYTSKGTYVTSILDQLLLDAGCRNIHQKWHTLDFSAGAAAHQSVCSNLAFALKLTQPFLLAMVPTTQKHLDELYEQGVQEMRGDDFRARTNFLTAWGIKSEQDVHRS